MQKHKIYISGKMGGLTDYEINKNFHQAKIECETLGFEVISPNDLPHQHGRTWPEFMREDIIAMITHCSHIYALKNWRDSPGARIEINLALELGFNIIQQK